jgi:hypothetical protein
MRRSEPLDTAALLINQDRRPPAEHIAQLVNETAQLLRRRDVATEQDESPWLRLTEKSALAIG